MARSRWARAGVVVVAAVAAVAPLAGPSGPASAAAVDRTSVREAARVDRVKVSLAWFDCSAAFSSPGAQCSRVRLPVDYDRPNGAKTTVALLRVKATGPGRRLGTLFVNPGGPGGSAVGLAAAAPFFLSDALRARYDIVGIDPRGTNFGDNARCWPGAIEQAQDLAGANSFPSTAEEARGSVSAAERFGRACSTTSNPLPSAMSTAEVARDMDVLRRTLGDSKLHYLGFSYGSYLGAVYANLFPDRVGAVTIDGVVDPVGWAGTARTANQDLEARLQAGQGADKALREILRRCAAAGPRSCALANLGNAPSVFTDLAARAKVSPLEIAFTDPFFGPSTTAFTYGDLYGFLLNVLYASDGWTLVDSFLTAVATGSSPTATPAQRGAAARTIEAISSSMRSRQGRIHASQRTQDAQPSRFGYDSSLEEFAAVMCTDRAHPAKAARWPAFAAAAEKRAPGFGPIWTWNSVMCASSTWTARDEDRYAGPFNRRTARPVLVVGNYYDPATNYAGAVAASRRLPNSRLLSVDTFGHTAYGSNPCATSAIDRYLLTGRLPAAGTVCPGVQPFDTPLPAGTAAKVQSAHPQAAPPAAVTPAPGVPAGARPVPVDPIVGWRS